MQRNEIDYEPYPPGSFADSQCTTESPETLQRIPELHNKDEETPLPESRPGDTCARGGQATGKSMNKRILLGIDGSLSPPTQHALRTVSELLQHSTPDLRLVLLHVIPVPCDASPAWGKSMRSSRPWPPVVQQRLQAEHALGGAYGFAAAGDCSRTDRATTACRLFHQRLSRCATFPRGVSS